MSVATNCVPTTAKNKIGAGRVDQNGPRVRVMKMVRCSATDSFRYNSSLACNSGKGRDCRSSFASGFDSEALAWWAMGPVTDSLSVFAAL